MKVWVGIVIMAFVAGVVVGARVFSKVETKTEKVYGLPEGTTMQGLCGEFYGAYLQKIVDDAKKEAQSIISEAQAIKNETYQDLENYKKGYQAGYNK